MRLAMTVGQALHSQHHRRHRFQDRLSSGVTSKPASRGHFKTGQLSASRTAIYFYRTDNSFCKSFLWVFVWRATRFILTSPGRRIRQRRDATRAPTQRPEWRGGASRPNNNHSGGKAVNPRGLGTESPTKKAFFRFGFTPGMSSGHRFIEGLPQQRLPFLCANSAGRT